MISGFISTQSQCFVLPHPTLSPRRGLSRSQRFWKDMRLFWLDGVVGIMSGTAESSSLTGLGRLPNRQPSHECWPSFNFRWGRDFFSFCIPRAHDAGRGCGRIGEFFDMGRGQKPGVRSQNLARRCWLLVESCRLQVIACGVRGLSEGIRLNPTGSHQSGGARDIRRQEGKPLCVWVHCKMQRKNHGNHGNHAFHTIKIFAAWLVAGCW